MNNRGDTLFLLIPFTVNGEPSQEGAYDEIELSINKGSLFNSIRKTLTGGDISWATVEYDNEGVTETYTGYVAWLSQEDTFNLPEGTSQCQLRVRIGQDVGSSTILTDIVLGKVLSGKVI